MLLFLWFKLHVVLNKLYSTFKHISKNLSYVYKSLLWMLWLVLQKKAVTVFGYKHIKKKNTLSG